MPEVIINVNADTYVAESAPDTSFGSQTSVQVGPAGVNWWGLMAFDPHSIPAGATIDTATLRFQIISANTNGSLRMQGFLTGGFSEASTWNSLSATYESAFSDLTVSAKGIYVLDCKAAFQPVFDAGMLNPKFRFIKQTGDLVSKIDSREGTGVDASITINYTEPAGGLVKRGSWRGSNRGAWRGAA